MGLSCGSQSDFTSCMDHHMFGIFNTSTGLPVKSVRLMCTTPSILPQLMSVSYQFSQATALFSIQRGVIVIAQHE